MSRHFKNIAEFRAFVRDELPGRIAAGKRAGLEAAGDIFLKEIHEEIGTYQHGDAGFADMEPLSVGTLEGWDTADGKRLKGKIERGLASPGQDNPLMARGFMDHSFDKVVSEDRVQTGSNDPVATYQNDGTASRGVPFEEGLTTQPGVPGREFVGRAGFRKAEDAANAIGDSIFVAITE